METESQEGVVLYKRSCDRCPSSDAMAVYSTGTTFCFSCNTWGKADEADLDSIGALSNSPLFKSETKKEQSEENPFGEVKTITTKSTPKVRYSGLPARSIRKDIAEFFSYGIVGNKHCAQYFDKDGDIVAYKFRDKDKNFTWSGKPKESVLFGQQCFRPNPKLKLVITEGEIDALSVAQAQRDIYPVVSLPNGAASAKRDIKKNFEYLSGFKELIVMFDSDEKGQEAALEVVQMFPPKYAKIAKLPMKDANELLKEGRGKEIVDAIFTAEAYKPESLKSGNSLVDLLDDVTSTMSYPMLSCTPKLDTKMQGIRLGELTVITAGSGSGKTTFVKELQNHAYNLGVTQGIIHLEEKLRKTMMGLVSLNLSRRLNLEEEPHKDAAVRKCWEKMATSVDENGNNHLHILDNFGSMDTEEVYKNIRYLAQVEGAKFIYLDHITMLVSGMSGNIDERRALDNIMTELASLATELNVHIFAISHLNNNTNGKPFEEGNRATVNNLRGSGSLKQLAFNIISLTRNQMAEDDLEKNTIKIDLLKCRETGDTGASDEVIFNVDTGRLEATQDSPFENKPEGNSDF